MGVTKPRPGFIYALIVTMAVAAGIRVRSATLDAGFLSDDYAQYAMLKDAYPVKRSPFDLYTFVGGKKETKTLMDYGVVPWWGHPELRLSMMRPLSSIMVVLDYALFGKNAYGFHIHSMIWWAFLVVCVSIVLREVFPLEIASIAVVLFAIEEGHGMSVAWLANRSALIALSLAWLGLWGHIRWRRGGGKSSFVLSIAMFSLALLAGEWAFPVFAYLFAFELLGVSDSLAKRLTALLPALVLGLVFVVSQRLLNYSPVASDVYVNPFAEPTIFLKESITRIPSFFAELVFGIPVGWHDNTPWRSYVLSWNIFSPRVWNALPSWKFWHVVIGVISCVVAYRAIRWGLRSQNQASVRELRWLLVGALLSLIPMVASFPSSRLVVPAFVGISVAYAMVSLHCYKVLRSAPVRDLLRLRSTQLALVIAIGMAYFQVWKAYGVSGYDAFRRWYQHKSIKEWVLQSDINDNTIQHQDIYLVNGVEHTIAVYSPYIRFFHGLPLPRSCRILSGAPKAHDITRSGPNQLDIIVLGGNFLDGGLAKLYRAGRFRFRPNQVMSLKGLTIKLLALSDRRPYRARFIFEKPLEDPSYLFLHSTEEGLRRFELPEVGKSVRLPVAQFPNWRLLMRSDDDDDDDKKDGAKRSKKSKKKNRRSKKRRR
jgi:hypothetical protein